MPASLLGLRRVPVVTEEVARAALLSFVNSKCCYSSAAAGNLVIQELRQQTLCRVRGRRAGDGGRVGLCGVGQARKTGRAALWTR